MKTLHITPIEYEPVFCIYGYTTDAALLGLYVFTSFCHSWVNLYSLEYMDMEVCVN